MDIFGVDFVLKANVYVGDNIVPLRLQTEADLIPYYPRIVGMFAGNDIWLSSESYVDIQEKEYLEYALSYALKEYRRCKRKKIQFLCENYNYTWMNIDVWKRVEEFGEKATIDGIHTHMAQIYRQYLYDDMVSAGWSKFDAYMWVYKDPVEALKKQKSTNEE